MKPENFIIDVDGVLTDGYLFYDHQGNQLKRFNVKDGLGIGQQWEAISSVVDYISPMIYKLNLLSIKT